MGSSASLCARLQAGTPRVWPLLAVVVTACASAPGQPAAHAPSVSAPLHTQSVAPLASATLPPETTHYPMPTCTHLPAPRFSADSWVAPPGLDPNIERFLRSSVFGTLRDPREGPLRQVKVWGHGEPRHDNPDAEHIQAWPTTARIREVPGQHPIAVCGRSVAAIESVGDTMDVVVLCRAARKALLEPLTPPPENLSGRELTDQLRAYMEQRDARLGCPVDVGAQVAFLGEVDLANAVLRSALPSSPLLAAEAQWDNAALLLRGAIETMLIGDDCLALDQMRGVPAAWSAFEAEPEAAAVCATRDCTLDKYAARWTLGLERRVANPLAESSRPATAFDISRATAAELDASFDAIVRARHDSSYEPRIGELRAALIGAGDAAIPALLARLGQPDLLMQGSLPTSFADRFEAYTVHDFVRLVLDELLVMQLVFRSSEPQRLLEPSGPDVAAYRARFEEVRGLSPMEKYLHVLRRSRDTVEWRAAGWQLADLRRIDPDEPRNTAPLASSAALASGTRLLAARALSALRGGQFDDACALAFAVTEWEPGETPSWLPRWERACRRSTGCTCEEPRSLPNDLPDAPFVGPHSRLARP